MFRRRVLVVWLMGVGCFSDNGPSASGSAESSGGAGTTSGSTGVMMVTGEPTTTSAGTTSSSSSGGGETSEGSSGGETDATGTTGSETTGGPVVAGCLDPTLVACFRFEDAEEPGRDESPYAHDATAEAAAVGPGRVGNGLDVAPTTVFAAADADHLSPGQALTMALWFNPRSKPEAGHRMMLLDKGGEYAMVLRSDGLACQFDAEPLILVGVTADEWTHLTCVHTADGLSLFYRDGEMIGMQTVGAIDVEGVAAPLVIGNDSPEPTAAQAFDGVIDEVKIWGRALTADEIRAQAELR